ncbi:uncharacterized protein [Epargyreus clarus]|uniref:uncharacterized protein n=1 Tax=Epargyreus clarus TaxID=520877 RepID=UPI003C2C3D57
MWLEVRLPSSTLTLGTANRPESVTVQEALDALSDSLSVMAGRDLTCILGDFNVDMTHTEYSKAKEMLQFCHHHSLEQLVKEPTRITNVSQTLLDLVMTTSSSKCKKVEVIHNPCLSDHALILVDFDVRKPKFKKQVKFLRTLKNINIDELSKELRMVPWDYINSLENLNEMVKLFNENIIKIFDIYAPIRKIIIRDNPKPWVTDMVKFMMSLRDEALKKAQKNKSNSSTDYYRTLKNFVNSTIERERKSYINYTLNKNSKKPALLWKNIKSSTQLHKSQNYIIPDHLNDPNKINKHFLDLPVCDKTYISKKNIEITNSQCDPFELKTTTESEVRKIINNIKTKATGHDNISIDMIKLTLDSTLSVITNMVNKSIETGTYPMSWKKAVIRPIPKKKTVTELKDLRPISILPVLSKIVEKVVLDQVLNYVEKEKIIPKYQSGFRKGHGTETALLNVSDDLTEASNMGLSSILVLLDYTRAFDYLQPELLLYKLKFHGFAEKTCNWFRAFLTNRLQMVSIDNKDGTKENSCLAPIQRGVPQGSLLSPILFAIFTADLPKHIKYCTYHLYADDTQLYYSFKHQNIQQAFEKINEDLHSIFEWSQNNSLVLNPSKSQYIVVGTKSQIKNVTDYVGTIKINNVDLQRVSSARNLGLTLDGEQNYAEHVNNKIRTAYYKLKTLYEIRPYIKEELRILLCDTLVLSQFNYCSSIYGPRLNANIERALQTVQNACVRFCFNVPRRQHITTYLNDKGILNMCARRELQFACTVQRILWNKKPEYLFEKLVWVKDISNRSVRSNSQSLLVKPACKSKRYRVCFKFAAASIWNDLPPPLRTKMSPDTFKTKYKSALLRKQVAAENLKHAYWKCLTLNEFFK